MNFLSLFAGIGGLDLGLERAGMTCVGQVEIDPFCRAVLARHWPGVERLNSIQAILRELRDGRRFAVDLVAGGFPCQDISVAGKGGGIHASRSGLWWKMLETIIRVRPAWVLAENVPALRTRGYDAVKSSLEARGYEVRQFVVGAEHVGAPHKRHRVWIVANRQGVGRAGEGERGRPEADGRAAVRREGMADAARDGQPGQGTAERPDRERTGAGGNGNLADANQGLRAFSGRANGLLRRGEREGAGGGGALWPARPGEPQCEWEHPRLIDFGRPQRGVGVAVDGIPAGLVRAARRHNRNTLKAAGNSVVPQVVEVFGRAILAANEGRAVA